MSEPQPIDVLVVGAGIAGLVVALRLQRAGLAVRVCEAEPVPGGVLRSRSWQGTMVEGGPNSFLASEELLALLAEIGMAAEVENTAPGANKRYVVRRGRLEALPMSPLSFVTSRALSATGKLRLLAEPFLHGRAPRAEESVRSFFERHFGSDVHRYVAAPFVSGVYAGDPERLSVRAAFPMLARLEATHPSLFRALLKQPRKPGPKKKRLTSIAIRGGNAALATALARALGPSLALAQPAERIERGGQAGLQVRTAGGQTFVARRLVLALPARAAATLVAGAFPDLAKTLGDFRMAEVAVVHLAVATAQLERRLDGFGHLVPRVEGLRHLGCIWTSALFPSRAPAGMAVFTLFLGGALDPEAVRLSEQDAIAIADRELRALGLYRGEPTAARRDPGPAWIAQYEIGHLGRVESAERLAADAPGIFLAGSSYRGVSVGDCVKEATLLAERVRQSLRAN